MRNVEPTRTPATTRKRARCQASSRATAGSLSLLAVPKLKTAIPAPLNGANTELVTASDPSECESRAKPQGSFEQQATSALVTAAGKENQPVSVSWAVGLNDKRSTQPAQPQQTQVQALLKQHPSQYMQQAKLESPTAKHPKGPKMIPKPQQAVPVLNSFHIAAPNSKTCSTEPADAIHTVDSIHAGDNNHAGPTLLPSLVKQTIPVPSGPLHRPAFRAEPEHELPSGKKVPLACQTVINKRRCYTYNHKPFWQYALWSGSRACHIKTVSCNAFGSFLCILTYSKPILQASCGTGHTVWGVVHRQ